MTNEQTPIKWWSPANYEEFKRRYPIRDNGYYHGNAELEQLVESINEDDWSWDQTLGWSREAVVELANDQYGDDHWKIEQTLQWWDGQQEGRQR